MNGDRKARPKPSSPACFAHEADPDYMWARSGDRVRFKRVQDPPEDGDGLRVLVDRLWPRGLKKENARVDLWLRDIAPSGELRKWFGHDPARWDEFRRHYREELATKPDLLRKLREKAAAGPVTLLFAAKDRERNNAVVLKQVLEEGA